MGFFMNYKLALLGTVAPVSLPAASQSNAPNQGWYLGLEPGANWVDENEGLFGLNSYPAIFPETINFDTGWAVLATVGYGFDSPWRVEFEVGYRQNDIDNITIPHFYWLSPFEGDELTELTLMANV